MLLQRLLFSPSSKAPFYLYHHFISPQQPVSVWTHQPSASASSSSALPTAANWGQCRYLFSFKTCFSLVRVFLYIMCLELTLVSATEVPSVLIPGWFSCIKINTLKKMNEFAWMNFGFQGNGRMCSTHGIKSPLCPSVVRIGAGGLQNQLNQNGPSAEQHIGLLDGNLEWETWKNNELM